MFSRSALSEGLTPKNRVFTFGAPVHGLNAKSPLVDMDPLSCSVLENWNVFPDRVEVRPGALDWMTGFTQPVNGLWTWDGPSSSKMFATCSNGVFDATTAGAVGAAVAAITNGKTVGVNITTGGGSFLMMVNGTDNLQMYDGAVWTAPAAFGGLNTNTVINIEVYKQRVFMLQNASMNLWYLPVNSVAGAATAYPLGAIFRRGGTLTAIGTWSLDAGVGPDDMLAVASSQGEIAVFSGTDPSAAATWALRGVYYVGKPLGSKAFYKYGGDLLYLSETGIYPMSRVLQTDVIDRSVSVTDNIQADYSALVALYSANFGWSMVFQPSVPLLVVNVPGPTDGRQFVMNTQSRAWSTYSGWVANCWTRLGTSVFYGGSNKVVQAMTGYSDFNTNIRATLLQAYTTMGYSRTKHVRYLKPLFASNNVFDYSLGISNNFEASFAINSISSGSLAASLWGTGVWGTSFWTGAAQVTNDWRGVPDKYAKHKALYVQVASRVARPALESCDALYVPAGTF